MLRLKNRVKFILSIITFIYDNLIVLLSEFIASVELCLILMHIGHRKLLEPAETKLSHNSTTLRKAINTHTIMNIMLGQVKYKAHYPPFVLKSA
jgi:hypothetical protein